MFNVALEDLHWTAGFLEGEGSFAFNNRAARITAAQVQREPLDKLMRLFGGKLNGPYARKDQPRSQPIYRWSLYADAKKLMATLYPLLSPRRQEQIVKVLGHAPV